jgi:D-alanyl-D-alanine carboxypeptidase
MRLRLGSLLAAVLVPLLAPAHAQQAAAPSPAAAAAPVRAVLVARLDSLVRDFISDAPAAGVTAAVVRGSDTLLLRGVGERDRERHLAADASTVYRIGSITKQFTSAAILQLVERGTIGLDDPVTRYLPQYPQWSGVTIRRLLNHTSGIHSYTANTSWRSTWNDDLTPAQLVEFVAKDTLDFPIGSKYRYNNTGYVLLGMVLEKVTGTPYGDYVQQQFFSPLGMQGATYCPSRAASDTHAAGYDLKDGKVVPTTYLSMTHPHAAGALCMSVPDYLKWQAALTSGRVVRPSTYAMMTTPETLVDGAKITYGFALVPGMMGTHRMIQHGGDVNGFSVQQMWFPDDSLRVVVFANTLGSSPGLLANNLAAATFGLPLRARPKAAPIVPLAADARAKYEGTYHVLLPNGVTMPMRLFADSAGLWLEPKGQPKMALRYAGNDTFGAAFDPGFRFRIVFENGVATKAVMQQGGMTMEGPRAH